MTHENKFNPRAHRSGHARKNWKVTFRIPSLLDGKSHKPIQLEVNEFTFEALGHDLGVAVNRALKQLRDLPEIEGASIRNAIISVEFLHHYTKQNEARDKQIDQEIAEEKILCPNCQREITYSKPKDVILHLNSRCKEAEND